MDTLLAEPQVLLAGPEQASPSFMMVVGLVGCAVSLAYLLLVERVTGVTSVWSTERWKMIPMAAICLGLFVFGVFKAIQ